ncbi:MAG: gamma carbonic anhydrase family protein [Thermoplasmatales archaeon SG8-52-3]|jgi:carbonic anhydrase/acetyltransferase-like protein (isoleucine patch superfamily)|nr:MAG: gamma carbonic anhydrase family protein [Thermoplasmatales archaeon SG8-52-3]
MKPEIHKTCFVAKTAVIIGNVKIGKNCGIYPGAVIRGDENSIVIEDGSNVQDCCVIHCDLDHSVKIGKNVTIGHCAMIHGATIEDDCLIGIHSTILNGAKIGKGSIIGANALVREYMEVPENSLVVGVPGKVMKQDKTIREKARINAAEYRRISKSHIEKKHMSFEQ